MTAVTERFAPVALGFTYHDKVSDLRRKGQALYGRALALWLLGRLHADREGTGGVIADVDLRMVYDAPDVAKLATALVEVGLWDPHPRGFVIHDFDSSGGVVLPPEQAAKPGAAQQAGDEKRRERNRRYREARLTASPQDGRKASRKTAGETVQDGRKTAGDASNGVSRVSPSQSLPSYDLGEDGEERQERRDAGASRETPQDGCKTVGETQDGETPKTQPEDGRSVSAQIAEHERAYPEGFARELRYACALARKGGSMADSAWLQALKRLAKHSPTHVVEGGQRFIAKHADGEKDERYLLGIVSGLERERKTGLLPVSPIRDFRPGEGLDGLDGESASVG